MKKVLGIFLMLLGVVGFFNNFKSFTFSNLVISLGFIGLGYFLFTKKKDKPVAKKSAGKTAPSVKDLYEGYEEDDDDEDDEDVYIPSKHMPARNAALKMYLAGSKSGNRQDNIESIYKKYGEIDGIDKLELVPDPDNKYNPEAIRVKLDGLDVGFIPDKRLKRVRRFIELHPTYTYWWKIKLPENDDYNQYSVFLKFYPQ